MMDRAKDDTASGCPRVEQISALMDGVLTGAAGEAMQLHADRCALCGATLREFQAMSRRLLALREVRCDVDLAALVAPRLPARAHARGRTRTWGGVWQLAPRGLAAAGSLAAGAYLGLALVSGAGAALRPAAMTVFDAVPPGALCAGLPACTPQGR